MAQDPVKQVEDPTAMVAAIFSVVQVMIENEIYKSKFAKTTKFNSIQPSQLGNQKTKMIARD